MNSIEKLMLYLKVLMKLFKKNLKKSTKLILSQSFKNNLGSADCATFIFLIHIRNIRTSPL